MLIYICCGITLMVRTTQMDNPVKQAHRLYERTFVVIDEVLVRQLHIDENTWFEQILDESGIFLRIKRCS